MKKRKRSEEPKDFSTGEGSNRREPPRWSRRRSSSSPRYRGYRTASISHTTPPPAFVTGANAMSLGKRRRSRSPSPSESLHTVRPGGPSLAAPRKRKRSASPEQSAAGPSRPRRQGRMDRRRRSTSEENMDHSADEGGSNRGRPSKRDTHWSGRSRHSSPPDRSYRSGGKRRRPRSPSPGEPLRGRQRIDPPHHALNIPTRDQRRGGSARRGRGGGREHRGRGAGPSARMRLPAFEALLDIENRKNDFDQLAY
jgi:hypothetical protein